MASKTASLVLLAFLFVATATPLASGFLYKGQDVKGLFIHGFVLCSRSPYPEPSAQGIAGVNVRISCNGGSTTVTQVLTNSRGFFAALVTFADGATFDQGPPCVATVELPHDVKCSAFLPSSNIRAAVDFVGNVVQLPTGPYANAVTTPFVPALY